MGRSKPRTNKRPPPKPRAQSSQTVLSAPFPDPTDSTFSAALSNWSANALGRLDHLPKLTQSQLTALTDAAAGVGEANFLANPSSIPPQSYNPNIPIDLPASLAALFEAKLTLDREKAKLLRMQQELKGQKEGKQIGEEPLEPETGVIALEEECTCGHHHVHTRDHDHGHEHENEDEYEHEYDPDHDYEDEDPPNRPLSEDPERLAVVWTIEQAAIVSGRRNWTQPK
ncbi:hypothetical protein IAR55_004549 [Kwoniella newhampshirensis]|uniref:Uncharacterized protein n=1 Tax=Kwoniella newhampshirensis TaxID=1651941 RepID=A0AAW0YXD0_9TREE